MGYSTSEVIEKFVKQSAKSGRLNGNRSIYFDDYNTLYSYGTHFPLLIRRSFGFLLNADRYSNTTSRQQRACFRHAKLQIPFSVFRSANINPYEFDLIDSNEEKWETTGYYKWIPNPDYHPVNNQKKEVRKIITVNQYEALPNEEKFTKEDKTLVFSLDNNETFHTTDGIVTQRLVNLWQRMDERRPQHDLIRDKERYFLSGMDNGHYFLCQLANPATSVDEALNQLIHPELRNVGTPKESLMRQGEWFFVLPFRFWGWQTPKEFYRLMQRNFVLPLDNSRSNRHIATRGICLNGNIYVSGSVKHAEHRTLKLSKSDKPIIYQALRNTATASFSASGKVD